jgi:hypothetical protein
MADPIDALQLFAKQRVQRAYQKKRDDDSDKYEIPHN